ncbi:MAG: hypothetical protein V4510_02415 [bacterium]
MKPFWATRLVQVACVLALAAPLSIPTPAAAAPTRALAITNASAHPTVPFAGFDGNPPKVFDVNGDGRLEIIAQNDNQWVYVFDSASGAILFQATTTLPPGWGARSFNGPEVALMTQGGAVHLVVANSAATVTMFRFDAVASTSTHFAFVKEWERRLSDCFSTPGMDAKPVLADLDGDGTFEIIAATEEQGIYALRANGQVLWKNCMGGGNAEPGIGDLNRDGTPDIVYGSDGGIVSALDGRTGSFLWTYNVLAHFNLGSGSMPVGPAVAQLDGLAGPDVVVGARDSHDASNWSNDHALLLALDSSGRLLWGRQDPQGNPLTYSHAVVADAAGDGVPEVYWGDWNTIGHKPPFDESQAWKGTGPAHFYRYDRSGNLVWRQTLGTWWSNKDVPLADVDGDGVQDMIANGPNAGGHDGLWSLDSRTGAKESFVDLWPWKLARAPVVADLAGNGMMQLVAEVGQLDPSAGGAAILVYDTGKPYSSAWPHLPYPTVGPAPPPSGFFNATFTIKAPNAWWQELTVTPQTPRTITQAQVRVSGGAWLPMSKSSWGAWTSSYHTVAGTKVEFLATSSDGAQSQSQPFTWLDGNLSHGSVPPGSPPPSSFSATFSPSSNINEWWVEVAVTASDPLAKVEANVNGGPWTGLDATSWGTWAKSFHVASGSAVQFRATSTSGDAATSSTYTWP